MKKDIRCLTCNISIYLFLDDLYLTPWDWDRQLCGDCSGLIPQHIPKEQFYAYGKEIKNVRTKINM